MKATTFISIVITVLKVIGNRGILIVEAVDWKPLERILTELEKERGSPFKHERVAILKAFIYGYANGETTVLRVWRVSSKPLIRNILGFKELPSYDTFRRFLEQAEPLMDKLFQELVKQCKEKGIISGRIVVRDTTDLPTLFQTADLDAKWNYNATKEEYYYGYALHVVFDAATQLPLAVDFLRDKKVNFEKAWKLWKKVMARPDVLLADSEYDILEFQKRLLDKVLAIIEYNPRKTKERLLITYRAELYSYYSFEWLRATYQLRAEAEHGFNILKELGLTKFRVRGYKKVKTHSLLQCMLRLGYALAVKDQEKPVTCTVTAL